MPSPIHLLKPNPPEIPHHAPETSLLESIHKVDSHRSIIQTSSSKKPSRIYKNQNPIKTYFHQLLDILSSFVEKILHRFFRQKSTLPQVDDTTETVGDEELTYTREWEEKPLSTASLFTAEATHACECAELAAQVAQKSTDYTVALGKARVASDAATIAAKAAEKATNDPCEYSASIYKAAIAAKAAAAATSHAAKQLRKAADHAASVASPTTPRQESTLPPETPPHEEKSSLIVRLKNHANPDHYQGRNQLKSVLEKWIFAATPDDRTFYMRAADRILEAYDNNSTTLNIRYLNLPTFPQEIFFNKKFQENITEIDFSGNKLTEFPMELFACKHIEKLTIANNQLKEIPTQIETLEHLEKMNFSFNEIICIPTQVAQLRHLREMVFAHNKIEKIPQQIENLTNLAYIDFSSNQLIDLPKKILALPNLKIIMISHNKHLENIPEQLSRNLTIYNYRKAETRSQSNPWQMGQFYRKTKNFSRALLAEPSQQQLTKKEETNVTSSEALSKASAAADQAEESRAIGALSDFSAAIKIAAEEAEKAAHIAEKAAETAIALAIKITTVTTPASATTTFPDRPIKITKYSGTTTYISMPAVEKCKEILGLQIDRERVRLTVTLNLWINEPGINTQVDLAETEARKKASQAIIQSYDTQSKRLNLTGLRIKYLPEGILDKSRFKKNLLFVDMSLNHLDEFPRDLFKLGHLKKLNLFNNQITILPTQIERLPNLHNLNLASNHIGFVPTQIGKLQELRELNIAGNKIEILPTQMSQLQNLTTFDVSSNNLTEIPQTILQLPHLHTLHISNNTLQNPPKETQEMKIYNFGQKNENSESVWTHRSTLEDRDQLDKILLRRKKMGWN